MASTFQEFPRQLNLRLIVGGAVAFIVLIAIAAGVAIGLAMVEESHDRADKIRRAEPRPPIDLTRVPEIDLERIAPTPQAKGQLLALVHKMRGLEANDPDGFVKDLIRTRSDLQGMPFLMGGQCRMNGVTANAFSSAVALTHDSLRAEESGLRTVDSVERFWNNYGGQDTGAGVAALTQIFGPQKQSRRVSLAKHLKTIDHPASTRALARATVFDFDDDVRYAAMLSLRGRSKEDYTDVLFAGLRHPWAPAAQHAARAIVGLERNDLVPQLVAFLAEPDPRAPFEKADAEGKAETCVREVVKINHHRNCLLCHSTAPANSMPGGVMAVVPTPGESFPTPQPGSPYGSVPSEAMIRADVTYLRQDFSVMQPVANAAPWPEVQRFDFLVRTRVLTKDEAKQTQAQPAPALSENHKAVHKALGKLTGKENVAPTAEAWAAALNLPAAQVGKQ
jgi:hypothetical protein